jgi:hypothetical protein
MMLNPVFYGRKASLLLHHPFDLDKKAGSEIRQGQSLKESK